MQNKQQLIEHIQEVLRDYEEHGGIGFGEEVYRIALEKLTAPEPVPDSRILNPIALLNAADLSRGIVSGDVDLEEWGPGMQAVYAAPAVLADVIPGAFDENVCNGHARMIRVAVNNYRAELLRRINLIESGQWKIVPTKLTDDMEYAIDPLGEFSATNVQSRYDDLLAVAPEFK